MARAFFVFLAVIIGLGSCTQRTVCPAFQSAYIYDKEALRKKFSYFQEDSTPKILTASKNKYLIAEPVSYRKKVRSLQTVVMKDINPVVPDSLLMDDEVSLEELERAAESVIDSTFIVDVEPATDSTQTEEDSVYVITKDREIRLLLYDKDSIQYHVDERRYNVDQDNYMWYLRDALVLPDVRLAQTQGSGGGDEGGESAKKKEKKGIKGFFKNLFKKKKKAEPDSTAQPAPVVPEEEDFDFVEEQDSVQTAEPQEQTKQKKGIFSFLKKKDKGEKDAAKKEKVRKKKEKKPKKEEPLVEEEKPKEEEDDDGF